MHDTGWLVDELALETLVYELSELRLSNLAEATRRTEELLAISRQHDSDQTTAVFTGVLASCYRWNSRLVEAFKLAKESADQLEAMDLEKYLVLTLNVLGLCRKDMGDSAAAFQDIIKALNLAEERGFYREFTITSLNLAYLYAHENKREEAIEQYLRILDRYADHCKPFEIPVILNNLCSNYLEISRFDEALEYADKAEKEVDQEVNKYLYSRILSNKATILAAKGETVEALKIAERVQALCQEQNRLSALPSAWFGLGEVFFNAGHLEESKTILEEALELSSTIEGQPYRRRILELLAKVYCGLAKHEQAYEALKKASELAAAHHSEQTEVVVKNALLRHEVENWEKQAAHLREMNLELVAVNQQAETVHRVQREILLNLSSEIREPIETTLKLADELLRSDLSDEQLEKVRTIRSYCANLLTLATDSWRGVKTGFAGN